MAHTFVIAEAAATHDGSFVQALRLVRLAATIGADACKFQWCSSPERLAERRRAPEYLEHYRLLAFPTSWHAALAHACTAHGIEYMCTVYLPEDVAVIAPHVRRFKVASFEAGAEDLWEKLGEDHKPILASCGMNEDPLQILYEDQRQILLYCVSAYPAPDDQMNLAVIRNEGFTGFSDHSLHPWTGALAVAVGAQIVEFHVRLDDTDPANPDFAVARDPLKAAAYVRHLREAEALLGDGIKAIQECERPWLRYRVGATEEGA